MLREGVYGEGKSRLLCPQVNLPIFGQQLVQRLPEQMDTPRPSTGIATHWNSYTGIASMNLSSAFEAICTSEHEIGLFLQGTMKSKPEKVFPDTECLHSKWERQERRTPGRGGRSASRQRVCTGQHDM